MSANIDLLEPTKSLIDMSTYSDNDFGLAEYTLSQLFDDLILAQYVDENDTGDVMRGGIVVPANTIQRAWRIGRVVLAGVDCRNVKEGDYIIFPHDKGVPVSGVEIENKGKLDHGVFLNEERLFGVCKPSKDESVTNSTEQPSTD